MLPEESNYWLTTASMPSGTAGALPSTTDVAVIGAGFTGLSAARTLARRGAKGMVLTGRKLSPQKLAKRYGIERTRRMYAASLASIGLVEQIVREENISCAFSRCGHLEVACKASHFDDYAQSAEFIAREFNHQLRIIPKNKLAAEIGSDIYFGGMVDETSAGVNPAQYVAGLAAAALRSGAQVYENARVAALTKSSRNGTSGFEVRTSRGGCFAQSVLVATSGYTSQATPQLQKKIIPVGSFIIATECLQDALARELSPRSRMIY